MAIGPGKYDDIASHALRITSADSVIMIVLGGSKGSGFSVVSTRLDTILSLPHLLRQTADEIEKDIEKDMVMGKKVN
jgi:hypothetical protein